MKQPLRVLLIDDDEEEYILLEGLISSPKGAALLKLELDWIAKFEEAITAFTECRYDVYLVDYHLGNWSGLDLIREAAARECHAPIIMLTGQGNYEIDIAAMQAGAADYIVKGQLTLPLLERSIRYAIDRKRTEQDLASLVQERTRDLALLEKQAQEMTALQKATSSLLTTLDLSHLIGQILDAAQEAIPVAERSWLHLLDQPNSKIDTLSETDLSDPRIRRLKIQNNQESPLKTVCDGQSVLIDDVLCEPLLLPLVENEQEGCGIRSAVIAPLVVGQSVIGALSLSSSQPSAFTESDLRLLTSFATTAAAATQNALLFREVHNLATTDPLTGKLNRRAFFELGQREVELFQRYGHPLSAMMFDVNHFKGVNDTYGHAAGDQVLTTIADRCCAVLRQVDILGRLGGDEFAILLPEADDHIARDIAERLRSSITGSPIVTDSGPVSVSVSMGVAQAAQATSDLSALLSCADQALYQSKQAGRNCVMVSSFSLSPCQHP